MLTKIRWDRTISARISIRRVSIRLDSPSIWACQLSLNRVDPRLQPRLNCIDPRLQPRLNCIDLRLQHRETGFEALHGHQLIDGFPHDLHDGLGLFGLDARSLESAGSAKCIKRRIGHAGFPVTRKARTVP